MITLLRAVFLLSVLMIMTAVPIVAFAAENPDMVTATRETAVRGSSDFAPTQSQLYELGFVALIGLATLGVQALVLFRNRAPVSDATRMTMITLIITLAVGTLVMGYDEKQIAPVLGLFGSIAGYLLGRGERAEERRSEQGPKEPGQ
jgi:hypothetical protein